MMHSILSAFLILALLGSGEACAWICQDASARVAATDAAPPSSCHESNDAGSEGSAPSPGHGDCSTCDHRVALTSAPESLGDQARAPDVQPVHGTDLALLSPIEALAPQRLELAYLLRLPPRDILALTTTLRV